MSSEDRNRKKEREETRKEKKKAEDMKHTESRPDTRKSF
jgi:hypothetical protein